MTKKTMDCIIPFHQRQSMVSVYAQQLCEALRAKGVVSHMRVTPENKAQPGQFLDALVKASPLCTFSFNGILPDQEGRTLADLFSIPHLSIITQAPTSFYDLVKSRFTIMSLVDQGFVELVAQAGGDGAFFLPLAAPHHVESYPGWDSRPIRFLMMPDLIEVDRLRQQWCARYPAPFIDLLDDVVHQTLTIGSVEYTPTFFSAFDFLDTHVVQEYKSFRSLVLLHELEMVLRAEDQMRLLRRLCSETIDLLIPKGTRGKWEAILAPVGATFRFHEGASFDRFKSLIKESQFVLHSAPHIKRGALAVPFTALMYGAGCITSANSWLQDRYGKDQGMWFYTQKKDDGLESLLRGCFEDVEGSKAKIERGRATVCRQDTWLSRVDTILEQTAPKLGDLHGAVITT